MALIRGIDVSRYQTITSWASLSKSVDFVIVKCTEGTTAVSDTFQKYFAGAKTAGVLRGTYHFAHPKNSALTEARHYVAVLKLAGWRNGVDLPPVLDIEATEGHGKAALTAWVLAFVNEVDRLLGLTSQFEQCGIYSNNNYLDNLLDGTAALKGRWLWLASWPNRDGPWPASMPAGASLWQWTDRVHVAGVAENTDANVATLATLQKLAPKFYNVPEEDVPLSTADVKKVWTDETIPNRNDPAAAASSFATPAGILSNIEATQDQDHAKLAELETSVAAVSAKVATLQAAIAGLRDAQHAYQSALPDTVATALTQALSTGVVKVQISVGGQTP